MHDATIPRTADASALFEPLQIGDLGLPNRIVMAPLTRCRSAPPDNTQTPLHALYYAQRASAGLIVSEATQISQEGQGYAYTPGIFNDAQVDGWKLVTDAVHNAGGRIFCQLWHVGAISHEVFHGGAKPVSSSAWTPPGHAYVANLVPGETKPPHPEARALETDEIPRLIDDYRHAARCAKAAGFDGVELHAANGYLIQQFMRSAINKRTDHYGGSLENRLRLLDDVVAALCEELPAGRVGVRLSPWSDASSKEELMTLYTAAAELISGRGLAYLHSPCPTDDAGKRIVASMRATFDGPFIANNEIEPGDAAGWLEEDRADAVAFGRMFISNPDLPARIAAGGPYTEPDKETFYGGGAEGYVDYPTLHRTRGHL
ncbi:MAG: alkene reductase [Planctomycetota bacterium]